MKKRGRCNSAICKARLALTEYLDELLDDIPNETVDRERNTNWAILQFLAGNYVSIYKRGEEDRTIVKGERIITPALFQVLYELCEDDDDSEK